MGDICWPSVEDKYSSIALEDILHHCSNSTTCLVAYFYIDFNDVEKRLPWNVIRWLLLQLSLRTPNGRRSLQQLYSSCQGGQSQPREDAVLSLLKQIMADSDHTYIIIDALDECTDRDKLLEFIRGLVTDDGHKLHLLTTSRPEREIKEQLTEIVTSEVNIQSAVVNDDIRLYIQDRLHNDSKLKKWPTSIQHEIEETLMQKAHGMCVHLLVRLVIYH